MAKLSKTVPIHYLFSFGSLKQTYFDSLGYYLNIAVVQTISQVSIGFRLLIFPTKCIE